MYYHAWKQVTHVQQRDSSGKPVPTLRHCISITDYIKINEQIERIGPLYLQTRCENDDLITLTERYGAFEPGGVWNVAILVLSK